MKILATVLLGPGSEKTVGDAIRSVLNDVDGFVLIESGGGADAVAVAQFDASPKWSTTCAVRWTGDYGAARNAALDVAREFGADYALTLDPDERVHLKPGWRNQLTADPVCESWILPDRDQGYFKERVLRCDSGVRWHGRVCEYLDGLTVNKRPLPGDFTELPKDEAAERRRWERGVVECTIMIGEGDERYRWYRHRGACLMGLGQVEKACEDYERALGLATTPEETAWISYLLAEQLVLRAEYADAVRAAGLALAWHAGFLPEFSWIMAYSELKLGNAQNASRWAQIGSSAPDDKTRVGFRAANCRSGCRSILQSLHGGRDQFQADDFERRKAFAANYHQLASAVVEVLWPHSHLDLGAGNGLLVQAMKPLVPRSHGIELEVSAMAATREDIRAYISFGVGVEGWPMAPKAELVSCLEVLEHLAPDVADLAVEAICSRSERWVLFSAAQPGQAGKGHINCRPKDYWVAQFDRHDFMLDEAKTLAIVATIRDMQPCSWLPRNIMVFRRWT